MGLSFSTGAFLAGVVVAGSTMGRQMRQDLSPISDLFVIFFFLSLGLLLDVGYVASNVPIVLLFLAAIVIGKVAILSAVFSMFKSSRKEALLTALLLGQIGEEAFLVVYVAMTYGIMNAEMFSLVVAGAVISIALNPVLVQYAPAISKAPQGLPALLKALKESLKAIPGLGLRRHAIVCGYGSLGQKVAQALALNGVSFLVIEEDPARISALKKSGFQYILGDPASAKVLQQANVFEARSLVVTLPDPLASERIIQQAKGLQPDLGVVSIHPNYDDRLGLSNYVLRHDGISSSILKKLLDAAKAGFPNKTYAYVEPY
jgi:CPA2 family monovalent cation:H+ antiporter-2